ncbi:hypothetical protein RE474_12635 [Methanolobus sediminis]|uniref:DUF11 domain-containing protein n=1 Tax=Methanolobus sediminis TaxID=3072978 RepID=A0AA51YLG6_9EURY|nr:hypothetical protein [Methanolobus sediminis]WMW24912.1 hypothetical protein RE474_12635 [Methanolobus sediminis]
MRKTKISILCLLCLAVLLLFSSYLPLASANTECPCDDLDDFIEWVDEGSISVQWGQVETVAINGEVYTFRADDFDEDLNAALISIERDGIVRKEFLFLTGSSDRRWLEWDNEVAVVIADITLDGYKTPSVKLELYSRGRPSLEIEFEASEETVQGVDVSSEQYAPGEEKQIDVTIKNTGDAWIENVILEIDTGEMRVRSRGEFEYRDGILKENLGCLAVDDSIEMNFTVVAPEWDGKTSPYDIYYNIYAIVTGYDIKEESHEFNGSLNLNCTDPELKVVTELVNEEINMSTWYVKQLDKSTSTTGSIDYEIWGADEYSFLRTHVYNMGLYAIDNMDVQFSVIPEDIAISDIYESGDYSSMDTDGQYYLGQKLVPIAPGTYTFDKAVVTASFFGENYSWESASHTLKVHGPHIVVNKKLTKTDSDYTVSLDLSNDGDRAAWINLTDTIPDDVNYVSGSLEKSLEGSDLPLSEWDLITMVVNGTQMVSVKGVLLPPGSTLSMSYDFSSEQLPDLPAAVCEFKSIWDYGGEAQSSYYVDGAEVKQYWKPMNGGWVTESNITENVVVPVVVESEPELIDVSEETSDDDFYSTDDELPDTSDVVLEVETESSTSFLSKILSPVSSIFDKVQQFVGNTFGGVLSGIASILGIAESAAVDAVENYLYAVVIGIALVVFLVVYTLISK